MGYTDDFNVIRLVLGYPTEAGYSSVSVPMIVLHEVVNGDRCPTTLPSDTVQAMLHQKYLAHDGDELVPGPRMLWQTGRQDTPN